MNDPWNPSHDEIVAWADDPVSEEPTQDWDLVLIHARHERTYLQIAANDRCPKQEYFLHVLYLLVGDAVRSGYRSLARPLLEGIIERGDEYPHRDIALWQVRSRELMRHPERFEYAAWCGGELARQHSPVKKGGRTEP